MILVHRLKGEPLFVNADLIQSVEANPDTVLTLVDGRKVFVAEAPDVVVQRIVRFRGAVLNAADELRDEPKPPLTIVPREER